MQSLSTCAIITAPLGLSGCHGSPRSNITLPYMSPPTRIQNASTTLTLNSSRVVHSLISVLQLASNNIIPSSSATNSITKNANVEFAKLDLITSSSLQQSTTKSLLSEMLKKQVEQRMNKNKLSPMQRKPIMILPTRRIKNTENNQGHNRVMDAKAKSLKFGNCPLVVRAQKDDFSVGNDTSVTDSETGESSQDNTRKDNIVAATYSTVATRKTSFFTSASIIRVKNDDTNINITNVMSLKSTKLFSPPPMKKGNRNHGSVYNDEVEDSDDDGYIEDDEYEEEEEEEEDDDDDDDDEEEEEEEEEEDNEEYNINYGDHLSVLINSPASYRRTTSNYSTALSSLTPKPNMISENAANNNNHGNNPRHGTLGNATSHPMMPRKTKSFPPYNDSHPINWHMNMKKGIPIPQPSMSNLNTDYRHQHYRRKKHRYGKVGKNSEVMNDNIEREGLREARNGEEGMFWPMSI